MVGKKEYAQINELLNARLDAKKVLIAVHRGAWGGNIIEGTVPSLELALKMGADMFECDLSKSTDGVIYAFHDTQEPRLLKTKQNVKTMTSAEIDALEFYNSIDEPSGKHVQRFEEVVKYFTHGELFNIDRSWPILAETHELLKDYPHVVKQAIIKTPVKDEYLEFFQNCPVKYMYMPIVYNIELDARISFGEFLRNTRELDLELSDIQKEDHSHYDAEVVPFTVTIRSKTSRTQDDILSIIRRMEGIKYFEVI